MSAPQRIVADARIIAAARHIYTAPEMNTLRAAHSGGRAATVLIDRYKIQYEPLPFSGMTAFSAEGFVLGKEAFSSESELKKTLLHELYRLHHSELARNGAVDKDAIRAETNAAFNFAERSYNLI